MDSLDTTSRLAMDFDARHETGRMDPAPGFYRNRASVFFVTEDGRIFLIGSPDEPVCLRPLDRLPTDAEPTHDVRDAAHHLVAETATNLARPLRLRLMSEVGRDARLLTATLLQDLLADISAELGALLLDEHPPDLERFHDRLGELLEWSREHRRDLNDQRLNQRGRSPTLPSATARVPWFLVPFRHRGEFLGAFSDLRSAGEALGVPSVRDAHLRGELWTIARGGLVYVFRCWPEPP